MGDGWEIPYSSSEKVQSVHSKTHCVSQIRNTEGASKDLSKFNLDFKSAGRFSERSDIAHLDPILLGDNSTPSLVLDVKQHQTHREGQDISTCAFVEYSSEKAQSGNSSNNFQETTIVLEEDPPVNENRDVNMETQTTSKYQSSSLKQNVTTQGKVCSKGGDFREKKAKDISAELSLEGKTNSHEAVVSLKEETIGKTGCREEHISTETEMQNKPKLHEKENSKRRISFRALVRMKGLGRRMKKKHQITKKREKLVNSRNESGQTKEFKSDSSAKYLLESSTSTSEEQTLTQMKMIRQTEQGKCQCHKSLKRTESFNNREDAIFQNRDECSSSENLCSLEYLERRRGAVCEELEKTLLCGEQTLADMRAILVVQQKLSGFGLL